MSERGKEVSRCNAKVELLMLMGIEPIAGHSAKGHDLASRDNMALITAAPTGYASVPSLSQSCLCRI